MSEDCSVGIDVGKDQIELAEYPDGTAFKGAMPRTATALDGLVKRLKKAAVLRVTMEASGGYERLVAARLHLAGIKVYVVQPQRVRSYAKSKGIRAKNDAIDAKVIAEFGAKTDNLLEWKPLGEEMQRAVDIMSYRDALIVQRTSEKNRLQGPEGAIMSKMLKRHIKFLDKVIKELERDLEAALKTLPEIKETRRRLETVKGVGPIVSARLATRLPELGKVGKRQLAALVGVAPFDNESGKYAGKRRIHGGRADVRTALYQAAFSASLHNPIVRDYYARLRAKGKDHAVALTACAHKLLNILDALLRHGKDWDLDFALNDKRGTRAGAESNDPQAKA